MEGAKTASWLNKSGMVVSKSKFSSESGGAKLDMDDPMFWQKVMPDFVTPSIMVQKLDELSTSILGKSIRKKKSNRGRGRWKKHREEKAAAEAAAKAEAEKQANGEVNGANGEANAKTSAEGEPPKTTEGETKADEPAGQADSGTKADAMDVDSPEGEANADAGRPNHDKEGEREVKDDAQAKDGEETKESETPAEDDDDDDEDDDDDDNDEEEEEEEEEDEETKEKKKQITRTNQRKVAKYISDLKSMMETVIDEVEDESLPNDEKEACKELLLQISIMEGLFNEQQRHYARSMLKLLEGRSIHSLFC